MVKPKIDIDHQETDDHSDSSCSLSTSCPELGLASCPNTEHRKRIQQEQQKTRLLVAFWGNFILASVLVIGSLICVGTFVCLDNLSVLEERTNGHITDENLGVAFTVANAIGYLLVVLLVLAYRWFIQQRLIVLEEEYNQGEWLFDGNHSLTLLKSPKHPRPSTTSTTVNMDKNATTSPLMRRQGTTLREFLSSSLRRESLAFDHSVSDDQQHFRAELFPDTTVMFADIEGFTAWSSVREPIQEALFSKFDELAANRQVFKVETVGDCYVAVCGLPHPRKDHAVAMARFARDCLKKMGRVCKKLELTSLGPGTGELRIRIGLHSGPVTGGVLRGEGRLQLFGDTVNTAARIEQTGQGGQIHVSHHTKELLVAAGKAKWVRVRPDIVHAKGKGSLDTYWLTAKSNDGSSVGESSSHEDDSDLEYEWSKSFETTNNSNKIANAKTERLVQWNCDILRRLLKEIVARRECLLSDNPQRKADADESIYLNNGQSLVQEVQESIAMPTFNYSRVAAANADSIELDPKVDAQLVDFVRKVAMMYTDNPFHNFEHASHVTMSVAKLLSRIVAPSEGEINQGGNLHDHTFGITSDPLTQFSCVLSALIHDADHPGVPNAQLVKEGAELSEEYYGQSVAEQHSVHTSWELLMQPQFVELRKTIYTTKAGLKRFRSLVVNSVMATDIVDKELKDLRNRRWAKAFSNGLEQQEDEIAAKNRKATIVIEHLIQASDVAHTMQHWNVYRKWNEKFFFECYKAYKEGRADHNPKEYWYDGEIGFFDYYIIPLAKKLKDCGVFGVSSDEYLNYAMRNREQWELQGRTVVEGLIAKLQDMEATSCLERDEFDSEDEN